MYLSKLELFGFKSFANKTPIVFADGITAVVGPNGCGKTNIVDAIRWALGEQRYSTLRSDKMEDVIFNGTKKRKPVGVAEVSVTVQNNRGILPLEYNELTITRRVFRSGESEYLLNRTVCRLKDIVSLFMDTGMGPNAYSVIELRMVETILSDKIEERRRLFEEAAGVTRYKARRKEALRKLEEVDADLLRVDDIIAEVSKAVNSLNRQARKAERYNQYLDRLRLLEVDVLQRDYASLHTRLTPLEGRLEKSLGERSGSEGEVARKETLLQVCRTEERELEERLEAARRELAGYAARVNEYEQYHAVNLERESSLLAAMERLAAAGRTHSARLEEIQAGQANCAERVVRLQEELGAVERDMTGQRESHTGIEEVLSRKKEESAARRSMQLQTLQEVSRLEAELERLTGRIDSINAANGKLLREEQEAAAALEDLRSRLASEDLRQSEILQAAITAEREFNGVEERRRAIRSDMDRLQNRAFELQGQIGEKMTRMDFLAGLVDRLEGYSESVQHLLRNRDWSASTPVAIADAVDTRDDLRPAIEAVLGDAAHYILVRDFGEAISGLQNLKQNRKGKATFACLSRVPHAEAVPFPIAGDGVVGWAIDLVFFAEEHRALFNFLFRNVLVVRDADIANRCVREYPQLRCATLEGDIFDSNGLVRGGSHGQDEGGLIGKKDQIARLQKETVQLKDALAENQRLLEEKNDEYNAIDLKLYAERMKQTQQELSSHERQVAQMVFESEKQERLIQKNTAERAALAGDLAACLGEREALDPHLEKYRSILSGIEREVESETTQLRQLELEHAGSAEALNAMNLARVRKVGELQNLHNERERLDKSLDETRLAIEQNEREAAASAESAQALVGERASLLASITQHADERDAASSRVQELEGNLAAARAKAEGVETLLHDERQKLTQSVAAVHETEMKISEIRHRISTLEQRAAEEYELTLAIYEYGEEDVFDLAQAKEEINDLRMKIRALGLVNPLAFEEWQKEKERLDLLTTQRADLIESRQTLTDTIKEINQTAKEKFSGTFEEVRKNFTLVFQSLFDEGDEADLILGDDEDPLEAGIDIVAKPRGKRPHSIDMLSGGEKTLTAIALLFAIYLVKPSPFCILDEVDAPLDDANVDRFIRILRKFSSNTQFVVVTHNQRTMAAADTLYGVTMEEEGVSRIVAVNFATESVARFLDN